MLFHTPQLAQALLRRISVCSIAVYRLKPTERLLNPNVASDLMLASSVKAFDVIPLGLFFTMFCPRKRGFKHSRGADEPITASSLHEEDVVSATQDKIDSASCYAP